MSPYQIRLVIAKFTLDLVVLLGAAALQAESPFRFEDTATSVGLLPAAAEMKGHAAGWGDVDGDGWLDLYIGTFDTGDSKPNMLFRNRQGKFELEASKTLQISTRATGALFADLDNDGDQDLYISSMPAASDSKLAQRNGHPLRGCSLFRNDGEGRFTDVSEGNAACPAAFGGRSATVLDFDGDGLLDLLVAEDPLSGYNGSKSTITRLFHNEGDLKFSPAKLPLETPGLGVAAADVNNDSWPDIMIACGEEGSRLLLNDGAGRFREAAGSRETFAWPGAKGDNMVCGIAFGDLNRDGLLDAVLGQHFDSPWRKPVANRVFINRGVKDGVPRYEDVSEQVGITPLGIKSPHVEFQDFDNDGWPDLYTSVVRFKAGKPYPAIFKHKGLRDGLPKFDIGPAVNDFPTAEDSTIGSSKKFFAKVLEEKKVIYTAPGPTADYDNDGKLDIFLANWFIESPSLLLHNQTKAGNWLQADVRLGDAQGSRAAIGARVQIYHAGKAGEASALIGCSEIASGFGYASTQAPIAHFGLGKADKVDVVITLPCGGGEIVRSNVAGNQRLVMRAAGD